MLKCLLQVWHRHKDNLIQMERYHFFASSCRQFGFNAKSLSQLMKDERESDGALATVLKILKRTHQMFFDPVSYTTFNFSCVMVSPLVAYW